MPLFFPPILLAVSTSSSLYLYAQALDVSSLSSSVLSAAAAFLARLATMARMIFVSVFYFADDRDSFLSYFLLESPLACFSCLGSALFSRLFSPDKSVPQATKECNSRQHSRWGGLTEWRRKVVTWSAFVTPKTYYSLPTYWIISLVCFGCLVCFVCILKGKTKLTVCTIARYRKRKLSGSDG